MAETETAKSKWAKVWGPATALMSFVKPKDERNCQTPRDACFLRDVRISVGARPGTSVNKL